MSPAGGPANVAPRDRPPPSPGRRPPPAFSSPPPAPSGDEESANASSVVSCGDAAAGLVPEEERGMEKEEEDEGAKGRDEANGKDADDGESVRAKAMSLLQAVELASTLQEINDRNQDDIRRLQEQVARANAERDEALGRAGGRTPGDADGDHTPQDRCSNSNGSKGDVASPDRFESRLRRSVGSAASDDDDVNPLDFSESTRHFFDEMGDDQLRDARRAADDRRRLAGSLVQRQRGALADARRRRTRKKAEDVIRTLEESAGHNSFRWRGEEGDGDGAERVDREKIRPKAEAAKGADGEGEGQRRGLGGLWGRITNSLKAERTPSGRLASIPESEDAKETKDTPGDAPGDADGPRPNKDISAAKYFRRGAKKKEKCQFLQAVALFNLALIRQRDELGENHLDCGHTLNEIGVCWTMLGERSQAMAALEEALYIRQKHLGGDAPEVAETTNSLWALGRGEDDDAEEDNDRRESITEFYDDEEDDDFDDEGHRDHESIQDFYDDEVEREVFGDGDAHHDHGSIEDFYSDDEGANKESIEDFWRRINANNAE